jgi:enamine deaminase RidA (YjgF/YER057c/UK114 family)
MKMTIILTAISLLGFTALAQTPEELLASKGIVLPTLPKAVGNYSSLVKSGNLIYLSGRGPLQANGNYTIGKLGKDLNVQQGYAAAKTLCYCPNCSFKSRIGQPI